MDGVARDPSFEPCVLEVLEHPVAGGGVVAADYDPDVAAPALALDGDQVATVALQGTLDLANGTSGMPDRALVTFVRVGRVVMIVNWPRDVIADDQIADLTALTVAKMRAAQS
jgi:hypothetical protein